MFKTTIASCALLLIAAAAQAQAMHHSGMNHGAHMADMPHGQRQADVARRGEQVMPFNLAATTHVFSKTDQGGVQQVVVKDASDAEQVAQRMLDSLHLPLHLAEQTLVVSASIGIAALQASDAELGLGLEDPQAGDPHVRILSQRFLDQGTQHGIVEPVPPLAIVGGCARLLTLAGAVPAGHLFDSGGLIVGT